MNKLTDDELLHELKTRFNQNKKALDDLLSLTNQLKELNKKLEESEKTEEPFPIEYP